MSRRIEALGEDAVLLHVGDGIDAATNARVHACAAWLAHHRPGWLREIVPAYASLALLLDVAWFPVDVVPVDAAAQWLHAQPLPLAESIRAQDSPVRTIEVCYGGAHGPDLAALAAHAELSEAELIQRHCAGDYRVAMLGFAPGFPYLIGLDETLAMPRHATPRTRVPAGSVGIGGAQTGIYPAAGPGGWQIIGRTPQALFDPQRQPPALLRAGDRVRFVAVDATALAGAPA